MARKRKPNRTSLAFGYSLAIISIIGFLSIIFEVYFGTNYLTKYSQDLVLIVLGIGLIFEGKIRSWKSYPKNGLNSNEVSHIITGIVGLTAFIIGFISLVGVQSETIKATLGIIAVIAVIVIGIETWLVD